MSAYFDKRDRYVNILLHRKSGALLMFPHVCYMAGRGCGFGSAALMVEPQSQVAATVGKQVLKMLKSIKSADINAISQKQEERLRAMWRGEKELPDLIQCCIDDGKIVKAFKVCDDYCNINSKEDLLKAEGF